MEKHNKPTDEQLKELYLAAADFKKVGPWKWLYDADIICVENPKDKTMGYCSVMGKAGEYYALGVYLGDEGFFGFCQLMENADNISSHQALHYQNCIMCSFEDRDMLSTKDRKKIKDLGLSFRGRNAWPMFRRLEPGYNPWHINQEECIFLTHALKQTLFVATNVMTGQLRMNMKQGETILRYSEEKSGKLEWFSKEIQLEIPMVSYAPAIITDDVLIQRIKKAGSRGNISFQVDTLYMPSPVQDDRGERPYFPRMFVITDQKSEAIIDYEIYQSIDDDANVVLEKLIGICLENGIPKEIQIRNEAMAAILYDFCNKTGIRLKILKHLSGIDKMVNEMAHRFLY